MKIIKISLISSINLELPNDTPLNESYIRDGHFMDIALIGRYASYFSTKDEMNLIAI